ncbi:MAG: hypothetical protein EA351_03180 [Gemmatimonadales bacterium]|nr:MAG: hypothetical protein EA351_03180 [Gemmatimonadales bacterium]
MTTRTPFNPTVRSLAVVIVSLMALAACDRQPVVGPEPVVSERPDHAGPATVSNANVVEVIARHDGPDYEFVLSDDVIPAGWTTFELDNHSSSTHFVYLARVPDGAITGASDEGMDLLEYWTTHITRPFQFFMDTLIDDKAPDMADFPTKYADTFFPYWFDHATPMGGPGFTGGHLTSRTTVNLEAGYYIVECYVKNAEGDFHSYDGMISLLEVRGQPSNANEPRASMHVHLSTGEIDVDQDIRPGLHTVAVHFDEQSAYSHLLGHDVHLIRLDGDWDAESTADWMNWMVPDGLVSADGMRGPGTFVGGAQTMAAGNTAYMTVRLEPGEYAWVSEVPSEVGMWETFTVPFGNPTGGR